MLRMADWYWPFKGEEWRRSRVSWCNKRDDDRQLQCQWIFFSSESRWVVTASVPVRNWVGPPSERERSNPRPPSSPARHETLAPGALHGPAFTPLFALSQQLHKADVDFCPAESTTLARPAVTITVSSYSKWRGAILGVALYPRKRGYNVPRQTRKIKHKIRLIPPSMPRSGTTSTMPQWRGRINLSFEWGDTRWHKHAAVGKYTNL